jgi:hypothetical protein
LELLSGTAAQGVSYGADPRRPLEHHAVGLAGEDSTFGFVAGFAIDFPSGIPLPLIASPKPMWLI